ncbi:MAG TPA: putative sulfate exporter family transporter [Thermomicrobiales bacterium]|nr:putative sulfate exporter family transporter [Thermomicrobiales bacterium]
MGVATEATPPSITARSALDRIAPRLRALAPGLALCAGLAVAAWVLAAGEERVFGYALLEPLVLSLLLGLAARAALDLRGAFPARAERGVGFAAKGLLEGAIVLLGASLDLRALASIGPRLLGVVALMVTVAIVAGTLLGRAAGLAPKQAILVAVGNAVCGNSAIAAVAPAIRAKKQEVASAIALTAVLGVGVVLGLPLLIPLFGLTHAQYGILAGLTVYAVPQVLAATFPVSVESGQFGSLVKLTRVLLLGPVVAVFALLHRHEGEAGARQRFSLGRFIPWFVAGFVLCAVARTTGLVPAVAGAKAQEASKLLTIVAMAGLGLGVEMRDVRQAGPRVALTVVGLLTLLITLALVLILNFHLGV